jgi:hypothetical protein
MPVLAAHDADVLPACGGERAGCVIALLSGDLDLASAPALREELLGLLGSGVSRLVIDLSATRLPAWGTRRPASPDTRWPDLNLRWHRETSIYFPESDSLSA